MSETVKVIVWLAVFGAPIALAQEPRLQDPMRPYVAVPSPTGEAAPDESLSLTAVLVSDSRKIAVINGAFYHVGDRINGDEIVRIEPGLIEIKRGNDRVLLTLRQERVVAAENDGDGSP